MNIEEKTVTKLLHADLQRLDQHGAVHQPIHVAVAYTYSDPQQLIDIFQGKQSGFTYGRQGNPTVSALEEKLNILEDGIATACFSTGMAGLSALFFSLLRTNDHVVASSYLFGNTNSLFGTLSAFGCEVTFVDATQVNEVAAALRENTRIIFVETIANPRTQVADLAAIGDLCDERNILYVVDNTMTSPCLFRPADVKAGLVVNSLSKYIGGHGNALGGAVTDTGKYNWELFPNIYENYRGPNKKMWGITQIRKKGLRDMGATLQGESAHRIAMGAETLSLRIERISKSAAGIAKFLATHPLVSKVYYPGLVAHPQHKRASTLFKSYGGLISIELIQGIDHIQFLRNLRLVICSSHLGDNRTLAIPVADTIYHEMGAQRREAMGISDSLIRFSIGMEDVSDLIADFEQALAAMKSC